MNVLKISLLTTIGLASTTLFAVDRYWTGGGDGVNWLDANNWSDEIPPTPGNPGVPTSSDSFDPDGSTIQVNGLGATYSTLIVASSGSVVINDGGELTGVGANFRVIRYIDFTINSGGVFNVPFDADIRENVTINADGAFTGADFIQDSAILTINGEWSPGDAIDGNNVIGSSNGSYLLNSGGTVYLDLFGDNLNEFFDTTGTAATIDLASGNIVLAAQGGYTPQAGDTFDLWNNSGDGTVNPGDGSNISLPGFALDVSSYATDGIVMVVPEPRVYALVLAMAVGVMACLRRRNSASGK